MRSSLYLYNSLSRKKELFEPLKPPFVGLYVCGPTVYGDPHLGHARAAVTFDVICRYLRVLGYKVRYVRNITDVGHLEHEETEQGEDKILKKARLEELEPMEIAQRYTQSYHRGMDALNCVRPDIEPSASGHIIEQIELVKKILRNNLAYEVNGNVYFDLKAYSETENYGELSGKVLDDLKSGSRDTAGMDDKKNPHDFALWKRADKGHIMRWNSPWGEGYPGWHIECTAMSIKYLGQQFDIHGGGLDLQFPHHEAEIAQCKGAHGNAPVKYWMHNNMITIDGAKMSKSAGNFINLEELFNGEHQLLDQGYSPMVVRFLILQSHYRSKIDFSAEALQAASKGFSRLLTSVQMLDKLPDGEAATETETDREIEELCNRCFEVMNDDFNTAKALAALFELSSKINSIYHGHLSSDQFSGRVFPMMKETVRLFVFEILGLKSETETEAGNKIPELIALLISIRKEARERKDFATSDKIRDELQKMGIQLKDGKEGTDFELDS
ncbi:MAG: cysteine--tRNA ligase [Balneolaceae bacterium]|nr:MAG: cysteine--tRNA ligase [Balneolaceae bacterium]